MDAGRRRIGSSAGRFDGRTSSLRNPDGVMFYKIWNGRAKPRMPAGQVPAGA
jgi:hypothetical protein